MKGLGRKLPTAIAATQVAPAAPEPAPGAGRALDSLRGSAASLARLLQRRRSGFGSALRRQPVPTSLNRAMGKMPADFDFRAERSALFRKMNEAAGSWLQNPQTHSLARLIEIAGDDVFQFLPVDRVEEGLSPIGIAHFYRQLYFNLDEGYGPVEQAFTVAPLETLEVVYETVRRQVHEEQTEFGSEIVSERANEEKNLDEVSDKVSSMIQHDSSAGMSAEVGGGIGVWHAGATAQAEMSMSSQRSTESVSRRLKEVTKRATERISKSFSLKVRDTTDITTTNMTRRVIRNDDSDPVSYGLRRVLRRVRVKVQDLGPCLVWQVYVREPGAGLARSRFVHFREPGEISSPDLPPGVPPKPAGGTDTGTTSATIRKEPGVGGRHYVEVVVAPGPGREVTLVSIDSISDTDGDDKDNPSPGPMNTEQWDQATDPVSGAYSTKIAVRKGDGRNVNIGYTYAWKPTDEVLEAWHEKVEAARAEAEEKSLQEKFERDKATLTELSKVRPRPANDLRREERYEVMSRMISQVFARGDDPSDPSPLEIEYFHRYFDIEKMFVYTHPSWWRPRYSKAATSFGRPEYAITAESEPAALGSSLGWLMQIDGDDRRNEFLNSPWLRACMPIRPGRERDAIAWLARHVEGEMGYDPDSGPLAELLEEVEARREDERQLGVDGPDYVAIDSQPGVPEGGVAPEAVYPIVDEFDVTLPTEGFVYDRLTLV